MSAAEIVADILSHHGVKGQKWGVRRAEKKFASRVTNPRKNVKLKVQLHNAAIPAANKHVEVINAKYNSKYHKEISQDHVLLQNDHPITKAYHKEIIDTYLQAVNNEAAKMTNPSGTRKYVVHQNDNDFLGFTVSATDVQHADNSESVRINFIKDDNGLIIGFELAADSMAQSAIDDILEHHGIKGMKWGVRRDRSSAVTVSDKGKKLKTSGGHGHPAHPHAVSARTSGQIAKKSGVKALSDEQLQAYAKRIRLEQEVKRLQYNEKPAAQKFIERALGRAGNQSIDKAVNEGSKKVEFAIAAKRAAKVAAVAAA